MNIISVVNQKGGVGKTSISVNLSASLVNMGKRVLLIDLDIQSNATLNLIDMSENRPTVADCFLDNTSINKIITKTRTKNLDIAPSGERMSIVELNIYPKMAREALLKRAMRDLTGYDFVIIDLPPFLSLLTVNALNCSDYALVPVNTNFFSLYGIKLLNETIEQVKKNLNEDLEIIGYLINAYDRREGETYTVEEALRENLEKLVFENVIRTNTAIKQSQGEGKTIFEFEDGKGKGVEDFSKVAKELIQRIGGNNG